MTCTGASRNAPTSGRARGRKMLPLAVALVLASLFSVSGASGQVVLPPRGNPTEGGPYGNLQTSLCTNLPGSYCYVPAAGDPVGTAGAIVAYMDNAARNWGCNWNLGSRTPSDLGGGSWSKWYGNESDGAQGCGLAYWNQARQAAYFLPRSERGTNVAAASQGATVSVSSTFSSGTPASSLIDGNRRGSPWASGGGWSSLYNPTPTNPQWIQVNLNRSRTIREILVTTLQDNYGAPVEPTTNTAFTTYGIRNYSVDYWNGLSWVQLASTVANDRVLRRFTFSPVATTRIRVSITAALQNYARVVEVEAYDASTSSAKVFDRYDSLRAHGGQLGLPISNPVLYGSSGATYQQFTNGIITYISGQPSAFHVGGTAAEDKALAERYGSVFGISPTTGPAIYGLAHEVDCTNVAGTGCGDGSTGRYLEWWDASQGFNEMVIARTGWTTAVYVPGGIRSKWTDRYGASAPWNSELGFPLTDLLPTGSATSHQEFEHGSILWEQSGCASGAYTGRIVPQFRRPIAEDNLTMLCSSSEPANRTRSLPTGAVPFDADGLTGAYRFNSGPVESGWFTGATVRLDGGSTFDVNGPFYSAWIGGATGGGSVADALSGGAAGWGEPTGNATCVDNPCTMQMQRFAHGLATLGPGGLAGYAPTGVDLPIGFGAIERGYTTTVPTDPGPQMPITHRSGDFITLAWLNKSVAPDVTTTIYRTMKPLNGTWSTYAVIQTYPPPTLAKGTFTVFTDYSPVNNATICYYIKVSDGSNFDSTTPFCTHTLDGTTDINNNDHSRPRSVNRAQLVITVPTSPGDAATLGPVAGRLVSFKGGFDYNNTYLDSTSPSPDFALGSTLIKYDLQLTGIEDVSDIVGITVTSDYMHVHGDLHNDNLRISEIQLLLDNVLVFAKTFSTPVLVSNSSAPGGSSLQIGFEELRSYGRWKDIYARGPFQGFKGVDFASKLDSILAHAVFTNPGAAYHGSRLRDGFGTTLSKPSGFLSDRLHVQQNITADSADAIFCSIDYDLRITTKDINGDPVSPFFNGDGTIQTTEIGVEHPHVDCGSTFMRNIIYTIFSASQFYPAAMDNLNKDMEATLRGQTPSQIHTAPPSGLHFCFPGTGEGFFPGFQNGLSVCSD